MRLSKYKLLSYRTLKQFNSAIKSPFRLLKRQFSSQIQICIIGSGPSAFYTAQTLLKVIIQLVKLTNEQV